ncbi:MAG: RNA-binding protein [Flavobacteriales bacterium]|nr:RNA-binding protein [Flavobacteriales bacterium]
MTIYVGNISHKATEQDLAQLFSTYGEVSSAKIMIDKFTGKSRGFGFVEMEDSNAKAAIEALHEQEFMTRPLTVNEARPRTENSDRPRRSFDRNSGGGGYGGGNRDRGDRGGYNRNNY